MTGSLEELHRLWELLLSRLADKGMKLQQALVLVQFLRQCDEVMFWISDKVCSPVASFFLRKNSILVIHLVPIAMVICLSPLSFL